MKSVCLLFACILFSAKLFATAQAPDYLIIDTDTIAIHSNPLEEYLKDHPLPTPANGIVSMSTANWRGYVAYFKFEGDKLVVENIYRGYYDDAADKYIRESIYKEAFGETKNFPCDFYSGLLICPYGKLLNYIHMRYASTYEYYKLFEIKNGIKVKSKDFLADEFATFKREYYKYFKTTEEYKEQVRTMREVIADSDKRRAELFPKSEDGPKENEYLKEKEAAYKAEKDLDVFMFLMIDDYIKTIDIPNKQ
jgi:hypothetical protein